MFCNQQAIPDTFQQAWSQEVKHRRRSIACQGEDGTDMPNSEGSVDLIVQPAFNVGLAQ